MGLSHFYSRANIRRRCRKIKKNCERSLPDVGLPSHTENAKIEYVQILCNDVKKDFKAPKKDKSPGPDGIPPPLLKEVAEEISYPLTNIF